MKIAYLSFTKLTAKMSKDWFIDDFLEKDVEVEFLDISDIFYERKANNHLNDKLIISEFTSLKDLELYLTQPKYKSYVFIIKVHYSYTTLKIYRLLDKLKLYKVFIHWGESPGLFLKTSSLSKMKKLFTFNQKLTIVLKRMLQRLYLRLLRKLDIVKKYDMCFAAGNVCNTNSYSKKTIPINYYDYHDNENITKYSNTNKQAVFVDINVPSHTDAKLQTLSKQIDSKKYYKYLNKFFDIYENFYNLEIVIAAHPGFHYDKRQFKNRKVFYSKTPELIKSSSHVIAHYSNALSFAILNYKPISFIYTNEMFGTYSYHMTKCFANYLSNETINISDIHANDFPLIQNINHDAYNRYKYDYIISKESEYKNSFSILYDNLSRINL